MTYGSDASIKIAFDYKFSSEEVYKQRMNQISRPFGGPSHDSALNEAIKVFQLTARPDARKVVVIFTDTFAQKVPDLVKDAARGLELDEVKIVPVPVGTDADKPAMKSLTPYKDVLVRADRNSDPKNLAKTIMDKVIKGKKCNFFCNQINTVAIDFDMF